MTPSTIYLHSVSAGKAKQTLTQLSHHAIKRDELIPLGYAPVQRARFSAASGSCPSVPLRNCHRRTRSALTKKPTQPRTTKHSPACSSATSIDCSMRSRSMKLRKSSVYTVRSGSWKVQMGISSRCSLLPLLETWERARETMVELAWEMPRDRRFSEGKRKTKKLLNGAEAANLAEAIIKSLPSASIFWLQAAGLLQQI